MILIGTKTEIGRYQPIVFDIVRERMRIYLETIQIPEQRRISMEPVIRFDESSSSAEDLQEVTQLNPAASGRRPTNLPSIDDLNLQSRPLSPEHYELENSSSASSESTKDLSKRWSSAGELKLPDQGSPVPQRKYPKTPQPARKQIMRYEKGTTLVQYPSGTSAIQHPMLYDLIRLQSNSQNTGGSALEFPEEMRDDSKSLQCRFCYKDFTTTFARRRHETNVHSTAVPCEYCGQELKTMGRPDALQRHLLRCPALRNRQMEDPGKRDFM
eukprot:NODE_169_length_14535_cov_0.769881.p7 type:complete len:270 gc:universal NODE_169_length_14535_cov_0.769881:12242-11433(-)